MKNIVASADWHVHNWVQYSNKDENGISDRLHKYKQLAKDFNAFSKEVNADFRILAGDFTQDSLIPPFVINVEREVLSILNEQPTIICTGQHDLSSKSTGSSDVHSLLFTTSSKLDNLEYHAEVYSIIDYQGLKVGIRPWCKDDLDSNSEIYKVFKNANLDLFIGHDAISTATNNVGHQFFGGYSPKQLYELAPVSVCGDIHKKHLFEEVINGDTTGRIALIPGCPIQSTYKDDSDCGFWHIQYDEVAKKVINITFYNIHQLHPNFYHQFLYVDSEDEIVDAGQLVHYRIRNKVKLTKEEQEKSTNKVIEYNLPELVHKVAQDNKPDNIDSNTLNQIIDELFEKVKFTDSASIKRSKITKVSIRNFSSIKEFDLDFDTFDRDVVFVGNTGAGKSSVVEAIYWSLTNKTIKNLPVSSIRNWNCKPEESAVVSLYITIDDDDYIIKRTRSVKGGSVEIFKKINNEYCAFEANTMRETDSSILDLLNLKEWEIFLLSYYSASGVEMYNELGKSTKTELLNKIVSSDEVSALREVSGYDLKDSISELDRSQTAYQTMVSTYNKNDSDIASLQKFMDSQKDLINKKFELESLLKTQQIQYDNSELNIKKYDNRIYQIMTEMSEVNSSIKVAKLQNDQYSQLQIQLETAKRKLSELENQEVKLCPTCGAPMNEDTIESLKSQYNEQINTLNNQISQLSLLSISELNSKISEFNKEIDELNQKKTLENKLQLDYKDTKRRLDEIKIDDKTSVIEYLINTNKELKSQLDSLVVKGRQLRVKSECYEYLNKKVFKRDGYLTRKLNTLALEIIQAELDNMCSEYSFKGTIDENFNLNISFQNRKYGSYAECSTGQKLMSNVIMSCVLQNVFSRLYKLPDGILGLSVWDDIFSTIDSDYVSIVKDMLDKTVTRKYMVLTHNSSLIGLFNNIISVSLEDGDGMNSEYNFSFNPIKN